MTKFNHEDAFKIERYDIAAIMSKLYASQNYGNN